MSSTNAAETWVVTPEWCGGHADSVSAHVRVEWRRNSVVTPADVVADLHVQLDAQIAAADKRAGKRNAQAARDKARAPLFP
jgi:hypothetical protein